MSGFMSASRTGTCALAAATLLANFVTTDRRGEGEEISLPRAASLLGLGDKEGDSAEARPHRLKGNQVLMQWFIRLANYGIRGGKQRHDQPQISLERGSNTGVQTARKATAYYFWKPSGVGRTAGYSADRAIADMIAAPPQRGRTAYILNYQDNFYFLQAVVAGGDGRGDTPEQADGKTGDYDNCCQYTKTQIHGSIFLVFESVHQSTQARDGTTTNGMEQQGLDARGGTSTGEGANRCWRINWDELMGLIGRDQNNRDCILRCAVE